VTLTVTNPSNFAVERKLSYIHYGAMAVPDLRVFVWNVYGIPNLITDQDILVEKNYGTAMSAATDPPLLHHAG